MFCFVSRSPQEILVADPIASCSYSHNPALEKHCLESGEWGKAALLLYLPPVSLWGEKGKKSVGVWWRGQGCMMSAGATEDKWQRAKMPRAWNWTSPGKTTFALYCAGLFIDRYMTVCTRMKTLYMYVHAVVLKISLALLGMSVLLY